MARMSTYEIRFRALAPEDLTDDPARRLREALGTIPGIASALTTERDPSPRIVSGGFTLDVARGMAAAARDSSRFAKEALKVAGIGNARLVELRIQLRQAA